LRIVGDHWLSHTYRTARHKGNASSGGRELCYSQFDRHEFRTLFSRLGSMRPARTFTNSDTLMGLMKASPQCS